jgi:putative Holliday junction resolvase
MSGRILAVDFGSKRVGIALSDPLRIFAKAHCVIPNTGIEALCTQIAALSEQHKADLILVGIPYAIDGAHTPKTTETLEFLHTLASHTKIEVEGWDERYSSQEAEQELKKMGKTWQESRELVDAMAAAMILTSYLEQHLQ